MSQSSPTFPLCHVGCLCWVPGPLGTSVLCSDPFLSTSLCQQYFVCLCPPWGPLIPITTPPETVLVPHGTLGALQCSLYLSFRQNPSSGLLCAPDLSYLVHCLLRRLHSVAHPLRTSVHCGDTLSFALCPRAAFYLSFTLSTPLLPSSCLPRPFSFPTALSWLCSTLCALLPP